MERRRYRKILLAACCLIAACGLWGCREKAAEEPETELGVDGYVYLPEKLPTTARGAYTLPDGFDRPIKAGEDLFFRQSVSGSYAVGKRPLNLEEKKVIPEGKETVFAVFGDGILVEDGAQALREEEIFSLLDTAVDTGLAVAERGAVKTVIVDPDACYGRFYLLDYAVDGEQNLYLILQYSEGNYFTMEQRGYLVCKRTAAGQWAWRLFFADLEPVVEGCLAVDGQGGAYVLTREGIFAIGGDGQRGDTVRTDALKGDSFSESLVGDAEGNVYYLVEGDYWTGCKWMKTERDGHGGVRLQEAGAELEDSWISAAAVYDGELYLAYSSPGKLCRYQAAGADSTEETILKWLESNMSGGNVQAFIVLDPENFLIWYEETGEKGLFLLTKTPVEEMPERELVKLAVFGAGTSLEETVARFNRRNKEYYVVLQEYDPSGGNIDAAKVRMDAALLSSDPPDLIDLYGQDLAKDVEKGLLEDLMPYLNREGEPDPEDFLENILEGYTFDGKLTGIPLAFNITVTGGRLSQTGDLDSWTMEDVYALTERYPGMNLLGNATRMECNTRENLLGSFCSDYYLEAFVDWEEGTCSFDSDEFRKLLLWVEKYGKEAQETSGLITHGYMSENDLLMEDWIDFEEGAHWEIRFGEEIRLLGYPTVDGRGCAHLWSDTPLGMTAGAKNKEGAWEFLKFYLMQEVSYYPFSSRKSVMQARIEQAVRQEYAGDEPRPKYWLNIGNDSVPCYATRPELADQIMDFIEKMDFSAASGKRDDVINIVTEEAEYYYRGDKSLDEVVNIIQSRVGLMLEEDK